MARNVNAVAASHTAKSVPDATLDRAVKLLGGRQLLRRAIRSRLDIHEAIVRGIPGGALVHMVNEVATMKTEDVLQAVGVSVRTIQRRTAAPDEPLSQEQGGRAWKFAEVLAKATELLGGQAEAEQWLSTPAMALDRRRPVDLLTSPAGVEMVEQLLGRVEHGVYT